MLELKREQQCNLVNEMCVSFRTHFKSDYAHQSIAAWMCLGDSSKWPLIWDQAILSIHHQIANCQIVGGSMPLLEFPQGD